MHWGDEDSLGPIQQPSMRYKPRTDLERVFDVVNNYNYGAANKQIINNQLKNLELNGPQNNRKIVIDESLNNINKNREMMTTMANKEEETKKDKSTENIETSSFAFKKTKRRTVDNSEAKNILKDLYFKTHFKAASVYTVLKSSII